MNSVKPEEDDESSFYTAVVIRDLIPDVRLRLLLLKPESKEGLGFRV